MEANPCSSYVELFCLSSFPILDFGPELPNQVPRVHIHNYNQTIHKLTDFAYRLFSCIKYICTSYTGSLAVILQSSYSGSDF